MKATTTTNRLLGVIAVFLAVIAAGTLKSPAPVQAQTPDVDYFFEPGTYMVRSPDNSQQVYSKVVVDLRNGRVWAFPTLTLQPYPSDPINGRPQVSHPFLVGRFALEDTKKYIPETPSR
ncbi:MAG TPA: hypothetical protein VIM60_01095 [Edaphobacter sp.]